MRWSALGLVGAGLSLALVACGGTPSGTSSASGSGAAASSAAATEGGGASGSLTIWVDETRIEGFKKLGETFQTQTGVSLDVVQKPSQDIKTDFISQAPSGQGPDLIVGAHDWIGDLVTNGVISPVELGDATVGLTDTAKKAFTSGGQLMGVPYAVENIALVRNNKLATETPATFDELIAQGKQLTPEHPVVIQQGTDGDAFHLYPVQSSFGAPVFKTGENGEYTNELGMGGEPGTKFAAYVKKLADEKVISSSVGGDPAKQAFLDSKTAYIVTGPWWTPEFEKAGMDITVLPVPSAGGQPSAPFVGVQGIYLSSKTNNALTANQFLTFAAGADAQKALYESGGRMPALKSVADGITDETLQEFAKAGENGHPMPAIPAMASVWKFWGATELAIMEGNAADPAAAWNEMITNIQAAIKG